MELKTEADSDVPQGYKRTEVGVIPEDWRVVTIGDIADIRTGSTPATEDVSNYGDEFLFVSPMDLGVAKYINFTQKRLSTKGFSACRNFPKGSILFVCIGSTIGKCGIAAQDLTSNQQINAVVTLPDVANEFLYYSLIQAGTRIQRLAGHQAVPIINKNQFSETLLPLPPTKVEQEAIAEALSDADALIQSLEQLIAKKRLIKQGTLQELLTPPGEYVVENAWKTTPECSQSSPSATRQPTRLPGFSGEWQRCRLGALVDIRSGGTPSTQIPEYWNGSIPWCTPTDITALKGKKHIAQTERCITIDGIKNSSAELLPLNTIVMTSRATIGECAISSVPLSTNQGFKNFVPSETTDTDFLFYLLTTQKAGFISLCGGSTFLEIGKTQLSSYNVFIPPTKAEQTAIAAVLSEMDNEIKALESKLSKARLLKQGMMQELLTGRIRLVNG